MRQGHIYNRLKQYWGLYLPKLISHGTTVNGQVVYIATELVSGFPIGIERVTKAVVASAFEALNAVHASGMLHGDIREDNILVTERSVRLIDFGFSADSSSNEDYMKEREQLVDIISQFYSRVRRTDRLTGNNRIIIFSLTPSRHCLLRACLKVRKKKSGVLMCHGFSFLFPGDCLESLEVFGTVWKTRTPPFFILFDTRKRFSLPQRGHDFECSRGT